MLSLNLYLSVTFISAGMQVTVGNIRLSHNLSLTVTNSALNLSDI